MRKKIPKDQVVSPDPCGRIWRVMRKNFCVSEVRLGKRLIYSLETSGVNCYNTFMLMSKSFIHTLRESPNDAVIDSHALMIKAGLALKIANGLYTYMPLGYIVLKKIEDIIAEELDKAGFLRIKVPVIIPGELWKRSGRWDKMGPEMLKCVTRGGQEMVVSPTAEEAFTQVAGTFASSYKDFPFTLYQINTKYRDELRPRYGVMRAREFLMMDAYSFHTTAESLDKTYKEFEEVYKRIFNRLGLPIIQVTADSGAMGGSGSSEFMVESTVGDDTLLLCPNCSYKANIEAATSKENGKGDKVSKDFSELKDKYPHELKKVNCPGVESITQMEKFFNLPSTRFIKVIVYYAINSYYPFSNLKGEKRSEAILQGLNLKKTNEGVLCEKIYIAVAIRGDLEISETKLKNALKASEVGLATLDKVIELTGAPHGFVGPSDLKKLFLLSDKSIMEEEEEGKYIVKVHDAVTGANTADTDYIHMEPVRDFIPDLVFDLKVVKEGEPCPVCASKLYMKKGNELGHIFKLGDKYTSSMGVTYLDKGGRPQNALMGCYGIGVDRTLASIIEASHDEKGIIWNMNTAPYKVIIVPIKYIGKMQEVADRLYKTFTEKGVETLLEDRDLRAGVKFCDADLLGIPIRITVSERNLPNVEIKERGRKDCVLVEEKEAFDAVSKIINEALTKLNR